MSVMTAPNAKEIRADVAVIGAGSAGLVAYRSAVAAGARAVLIESGPYGTTCARVGCMPSKLLIAPADAAHAVERFAAFGLAVDGPVKVDGRAVMARVRRERDRFVGFVIDGVDKIPAADRIVGHARFVDAQTLRVDDSVTVRAPRVVIATGSTPWYPEAWKALGDRLVTNDGVFEWDDLPVASRCSGRGSSASNWGRRCIGSACA